MVRKRVLFIAAVLLSASAGLGAAAQIVVAAEPERLVEGHTVFTVLEQIPEQRTQTRFATAVAVLVREHVTDRNVNHFPGVLWFNDQYLVDPHSTSAQDAKFVYPCNGAVLATQSTDPAPPMDANGVPHIPITALYNESYRITDPGGYQWIVDKWDVPDLPGGGSRFIWAVKLLGEQPVGFPYARYEMADDGSRCTPGVVSTSGSCAGYGVTSAVNPAYCIRPPVGGLGTRDPGEHGHRYPTDNARQPTLDYNAVLYFRWEDLQDVGTPKDHREGASNWQDDVSGCHDTTLATWPCPASDDDREGNSHPYNPEGGWPLENGVDAPHGGSADCHGDTTPDEDCHGTRDIDVWFGYGRIPSSRTYAVNDLVGSTAPYHCHKGDTRTGFCSQADFMASTPP